MHLKRDASASRRSLTVVLAVVSVLATAAVTATNERPAVGAAPPTTMVAYQPPLVRSTGALLMWEPFNLPVGGVWEAYEVHRSRSPGFDPSSRTLVATLTDLGRTTYQDVTAAPSTTWHYRVVAKYASGDGVETAESSTVEVTTPATGNAVLSVRAGDFGGRSVMIQRGRSARSACSSAANFGSDVDLAVGTTAGGVTSRGLLYFDLRRIPVGARITSARLSLTPAAGTSTAGAVDLFRMTRPWTEGTESGTCRASGASWVEASNGIRWDRRGGDFVNRPVGRLGTGPRGGEGSTSIGVADVVKAWTSGRGC